jgi:hypothetical protein
MSSRCAAARGTSVISFSFDRDGRFFPARKHGASVSPASVNSERGAS